MTDWEFAITVAGVDPQDEDFEVRFYDAGCDDATISMQRGEVVLDFCREGETLKSAILSAIQDIGRAGAKVVFVDWPDAHRLP